jgi:hypothetical protein
MTSSKPNTAPSSKAALVSQDDLRPVVLGPIAPTQEAPRDALTKGCDPAACEESDYFNPI